METAGLSKKQHELSLRRVRKRAAVKRGGGVGTRRTKTGTKTERMRGAVDGPDAKS